MKVCAWKRSSFCSRSLYRVILAAAALGSPAGLAEEVEPSASLSIWRARAGAGLALQSYSLDTPSGNNVKLPTKAGPLLSGEVERGIGGAVSGFLSAEHASFSFPAVTGVSTSPTKVSQLELKGGAGIELGEGIFLRPAWYWRKRRADETRPIALVTGSVSHGLAMEAGFRVQAEGEIAHQFAARMYFPVHYREEFQQTGYSQGKLRLALAYQGAYQLHPGLSMSLSPELQLEQNTYAGTGARTVRDARERWLTLALPLSIRGVF